MGKVTDIMIIRLPKFKEWLEKWMTINDFKELSEVEQRKEYLRYKHKLDDIANENAEETDKEIVKYLQNVDLLEMEESRKRYFQNKIDFNKKCDEEWETIRCGSFFYSYDPFATKVQKEFGGKFV